MASRDHCDDQTLQLQTNGLNLISEFEPSEIYTLSPGDILYIPPGVAHWGVALEESLTFSLGFRAPSLRTCWQGVQTMYLSD